MAKTEQTELQIRIVIERPVVGVLHSLQAKDGSPLDPKCSQGGEPLIFNVPVRVSPGPKFSGNQVQREGPMRRFIYIRVGDLAGDQTSPWSRRMKIDIHDIEADMLLRAIQGNFPIETTLLGTAKDGSPVCATVRPTRRRVVET